MERFPRGTLPPSAFASVLEPVHDPTGPLAPQAVARWAEPPAASANPAAAEEVGAAPRRPECDLTTTCPTCLVLMRPEHAHYRCPSCGYRDSCCF